ncbi:MAG TPA: nucleoside hydrolase [Candidatus Binatia bacterium]|nr:nucleoside hydrolase [Candidatus Binatia bacterium]
MSATKQAGRKPVVLIHDAAIDEYISTMLLTRMPEIDLLGVIIINADCIAQPALDAASKLHQFLGKPDLPLALSRARGWNAFPWSYRGDCVNFGKIPSLAPYQSKISQPPPSGEDLLAGILKRAVSNGNPVTLLMTGPFTPLTDVLTAQPGLAKGIATVVWMGGAINVQGNLDPTTVNPAVANTHAEWNAFWDPFAVQQGFQLCPSLQIFPLDITDSAKLSPGFLSSLQQQGNTSRFSKLAYEGYSLVMQEPFYDMWDVTATYWLHDKSPYTAPVSKPLKITTWGFEQGWIQVDSRPPAGTDPRLFLSFSNPDAFYAGVLKLLA